MDEAHLVKEREVVNNYKYLYLKAEQRVHFNII